MGKTEKDIERAKRNVAVAHEKKLAAIDRIFARVKSAETTSYQKKVQLLDKAAEKVAAARPVAKEATAAVTETVADVAEAADKVRMKAGRRLNRQPWILPVAASVLFLALGVSVGKRYFGGGYAGGRA